MTGYERFDLLLSTVQAATVVVGFYYAHRQLRLLQLDLHNSVELANRQQAMEMIARYSAPDSAERRHKLRTSRDAQADYYECCALLNALEEIAIAHKHNTANRALLKDAFATAVRGWLDKPFIVEALKQARAKDAARYENLIDLYFGWGGKSAAMRMVKRLDALETK